MTQFLRRDDLPLAIESSFGRAEAALRFRGWQVAIEAGRWDRAFSRIRGLADLFGKDASPDLWRRLLLTGLVAGANANARGELGRFVRETASHTTALKMSELAPVLRVCADKGYEPLAEELGAAIIRAWPDSPVGWFARGDAAERRGSVRRWRPRSDWADDFHQAFVRRERLSDSWRQRIAVRYVVAALRCGTAHSEVREALKSISLGTLGPGDSSWLAFGLAHSGHWLDNIKACDMIDDRLDRARRAGGEPEEIWLDATQKLFETLPTSPHDAVTERLEALLDHQVLPRERAAAWSALLEARTSLAARMETPLLEADDLVGSAAVLADAHRGVVPVGDDIVCHVARCIDSPTTARLDELRRDLVRYPDTAWRPVAVLWASLLERDAPDLDAAIDRLGRAWCERAPEPSYGWWPLAAHFLGRGAEEASRSAAWRGLHTDLRAGDELTRDAVMGKILSKLVREADLVTLRRWLEAAAPTDQPQGQPQHRAQNQAQDQPETGSE